MEKISISSVSFCFEKVPSGKQNEYSIDFRCHRGLRFWVAKLMMGMAFSLFKSNQVQSRADRLAEIEKIRSMRLSRSESIARSFKYWGVK